jgi:hypothetical protein
MLGEIWLMVSLIVFRGGEDFVLIVWGSEYSCILSGVSWEAK